MYVLGIDGGGTKTRACLMTVSGEIVGIGTAGASSVDTVGIDITRNSILEALKVATNGNTYRIIGAYAGLGGVETESHKTSVEDIIRSIDLCTNKKFVICDHDSRVAHAGSLGGAEGINIIIGTGNIAYGRGKDGQDWRAGGYGYIEGDSGSSYDLGIQAIRTMVRSFDGRLEKTNFSEAVFEALGLSEVSDITTLLYTTGMSRTEIANLAPLVTQYANCGDRLAVDIVHKATNELRDLVRAVLENLVFSGEQVPLTITGSLGNSTGLFRDLMKTKIEMVSDRIIICKNQFEPVIGAALLSLKSLGIEITEDVFTEIEKSKRNVN